MSINFGRRANSIFSCIDDDGSLNDELYLGYKRRRRDKQEREEQAIYQAVLDDILSGHNFDDDVKEPQTKKKRNNDTGNDDSEEVRIVRQLSFNYFRERLIEHFNILFKSKKIVWPTRNKATRKSNRVVQEMMNQ